MENDSLTQQLMFIELNKFIAWADHPVLDVSITNAIFHSETKQTNKDICVSQKERRIFRVNMSDSEEQENPRNE